VPVHLQREIEKLKRQILRLSAMVEQNVRRAVRAFESWDAPLARRVVEADAEIDRAEVEVEEECLKIVALHQPVAVDLRYVASMFKINRDLERIGDLAVNIAEHALQQSEQIPPSPPGFEGFPEKVEEMLHRSLDALMELDAELARAVWRSDEEIDSLHRTIADRAQAEAERDQNWDQLLCRLGVARCLERMADHAANIAKDVIYLVEGQIVRHRGREFKNASPAASP
jgi:phosphate transport system protein